MSKDYSKLLTPFNIGKETIKNRFLVSPMGITELNDPRGAFSDVGMEYYVERAKGGFGAIYTGVMLVDNKVEPMGASPLSNPRAFLPQAARLNERCAAYGTKVFAEIGMGTGRNYPTMLAPSPVEVYAFPQFKGREISKEQIEQKRDCMIEAAGLMKKAGFAGVDVHALHWGYLLDEFVLAITNHREDEYGGSLENRMRIVKEIVTGIKQTCGADYPVTVGLGVKSFIKALNKASLTGEEEAGRTVEEAILISKMLEEMGVNAILTDVGVYDSFYHACPPVYMSKGHGLELYEQIKKAVNIPIVARSKMGDPDVCVEALEKGQADAFMMGRQSLADPYLPQKVEMGCVEKIRPCIGCNIGCIGTLLQQGTLVRCAVNPRTLREAKTQPKKTADPKKVLIVGGGVAGMEAACTATRCGHSVELYEKDSVLGGELIAASSHDFKTEMKDLTRWYLREVKELGIPVHLNTTVTPDMIKAAKPDVVILAVGASPVMPKSIPGIDHPKALSGVDALLGKKEIGQNVVVIGGGQVGSETAVDFAMRGRNVTLIEALPAILSTEFVPQQHKGMLKDMMEHYKVDIRTGTKLVAITDEGAVVEPAAGGEQTVIPADNVLLSVGLKPNPSMRSELIGSDIAIYEIGSGRKNGNVLNAVHEAFEVAYNL